jgi:endoglucanase
MKKCLIVLLMLLNVSAVSYSQNGKFVVAKGKDLVTPDGKRLHLRGINLGNWLMPEGYMFKFEEVNSPRLIDAMITELVGPEEAKKFWRSFTENYITQDDIRHIKQIGLNHIRIPFNYRILTNENFLGFYTEAEGWKVLDKVIKWCREAGIYAVLDMHAAPGGQTGDNIDDGWGYPWLFESAECQQQTIDIWKKIATRYKNETTIIGYDLLNEPIATYFDTLAFNHKLEPLYKRITEAIRTVDKNHVLFIGGAQWNTNFNSFKAPLDKNMVYTFHRYWCDTTANVIKPEIGLRKNQNVPLWLGESGENTHQWINAFRSMLDQNEIGWCFWPYKRLDTDRSLVSIKQPKDWDLLIKYAKSQRATFKGIRENRPDAAKVKAALAEYLENLKFKNCTPVEGYIKALGK